MSSEPQKTRVYLILGATGSGRRDVAADLIEAGLPDARPVVLVAADEAPAAADDRLPGPLRWRWAGEGVIQADVPPEATEVFFIADGRANPVDQVEALKPWLASADLELARVLCVVHSRLVETHPPLLAWYDACIHFSDVVLLNRREGVANKWMSDFRARYEDKFFPCLFELVRDGRVKNPALLLEPQARRISHYFDEEVNWLVDGVEAGAEDEDELEEGEVTAAPEVDPYFERRAGGRRVKEIPDIRAYLDAPGEAVGPAAG